MVCGDCQGTESGGEVGWVGSDVNDAVSRGGGRLERRPAHHLSPCHLQPAQERRRKENLG